ncbi:MAG TPA: RHS repeat-associated core domain-containing protein [Terriglobales bacterium]|nr:RHS repeat-associated core domain-containing protein [Terriglobales bacterium]
MNGQTTYYYLYGASDGGHPIAEYAGGGCYREAIMEGVRWGWLYQNGDRRFTLPDALGSTAVFAQDGTVQASRLYPFGEEAQATPAGYKRTNQIRDANALDHLAFRTYSSNLARWLSPDPADLAAVNPADPASWNRYAYVGNQPLNAVDPLGLCNPDDPSAECQQWLQSEKTAEGCSGAAPGSALFQACGGYGGYAGGGAWWQQLPDEFDLLTLPVAVDGATWVPGTTSAGPSGDLTENGQIVGSVTISVQTLGHFEWNAIVGTGSSIFLPIAAPQFSPIDYAPAPAAPPPSSARVASPPPPAYPRSYVAQLACEFGHINLEEAAIANVAPVALAAAGNVPKATWALGVAAAWDLGGAWSIREQCVLAIFGPGAF